MTMKSLSTASLIAALWLGTAALPAIAQGPGAGGGPGDGPGGGCGGRAALMFQRLDTNGDGKITQDEFKAGRDARFAAMDQNGDGKVTLQEFQAAAKPGKQSPQGPRMQQMFQRADTNGDGVITRDEFDQKADLQFKRLDVNGDGVVTRDEVQQARAHKGCPGMGTDSGPGREGPGRTQQ